MLWCCFFYISMQCSNYTAKIPIILELIDRSAGHQWSTFISHKRYSDVCSKEYYIRLSRCSQNIIALVGFHFFYVGLQSIFMFIRILSIRTRNFVNSFSTVKLKDEHPLQWHLFTFIRFFYIFLFFYSFCCCCWSVSYFEYRRAHISCSDNNLMLVMKISC